MLLSLLFLSTPAHAAGDMILVPDPALTLLQAFPFLAVMVVLHAIVYKPMLQYLEDREAATTGARDEATSLSQQADRKQAEYQARRAKARREVTDLKAAARSREKSARELRLAEVRAECEAELAAARSRIAGERELAARELDQAASALATQISSKVLGRELGGAA